MDATPKTTAKKDLFLLTTKGTNICPTKILPQHMQMHMLICKTNKPTGLFVYQHDNNWHYHIVPYNFDMVHFMHHKYAIPSNVNGMVKKDKDMIDIINLYLNTK